MPTVPTKTTPEVRQAGAPSQRLRIDAGPEHFGGRQAEALGRLGQQISQTGDQFDSLAQDIRQRNNDIQFKEARLAYEQELTNVLYGDGSTNNPGVYNTPGRAGLDLSRAARERLQKYRAELISQYKGRHDLQERLSVATGLTETQTFRQLSRYEDRISRTYQQELSDANKSTFADRAVRGWSDPDIVAQSESAVVALTNEDADRNGWAPEVRIAKTREAVSALHTQVTTSLMRQGQPIDAANYLEQHKNKMDAAVVAQLNEQLNDAKVLSVAQAQSDRIMALPGPVSDKLAEARRIEDAEVRKETVALVSKRIKEVEAIRKSQVSEYQSEALTAINDQQMTFSQWAASRPEEARLLKGDADAMKDIRANEKAMLEGRVFAVASDGEAAAQFLTMPIHEMAQLSLEDIQAKRARMTEGEYGKVVTRLAAAQDAVSDDAESAAVYKQADALLLQLSPAKFGYRDRDPGTAQIKRMRQATGDTYEWIKQYKDQNGKRPSYEEIYSFVQRQYVEFENTFFGTEPTAVIKADNSGTIAGARTWEDVSLDPDDTDPTYIQSVERHLHEVIGSKPTPAMIKQFLFLEAEGTPAAQRSQGQLIGRWQKQAGTYKPRREELGIPKVTAPAINTVPVVAAPKQAAVEGRALDKLVGRSRTEVGDAVRQVESGGRADAVSPKGARGTMQTMPGTLRDPGFGVKPAQNDSPEELERVGRDYLNAMIDRYDNLGQALVAYNWGPGNADKWIANGGRWEDLPKETQDYINKVFSFTSDE